MTRSKRVEVERMKRATGMTRSHAYHVTNGTRPLGDTANRLLYLEQALGPSFAEVMKAYNPEINYLLNDVSMI